METSITKRQQIKETLRVTRAKRKQQVCRVFECKLTKARLNITEKEHLQRLFLEAKWFYNHLLAQDNLFEVDTKLKSVKVKVGENFEERELINLSSQMKQGIVSRTQATIRTLASKKKAGLKIGKLKFKRSLRSIPLKQYGITYKLLANNQKLKIQGLKTFLRIRGGAQIPVEAELANAVLIKRHGDYFIKITTYTDKTEILMKIAPSSAIGIDMGLKNQLTFSNGVDLSYRIPVSRNRRLKKTYQRFSRRKQGSHNRYKQRQKLLKQFTHLSNSKRDIRNKLVSFLKNNYQVVCFQNENLKAWQRIWGAKMLDISLGQIKATIKERITHSIEIDRLFPSSQLCSNPDCTHRQKMPLNERTYFCLDCDHTIDRDLNAARNIEQQGLTIIKNNIGWEPTELTPVEIMSAAHKMRSFLSKLPSVCVRQISETGSPIL